MQPPVRAGSIDGLNVIYDGQGQLMGIRGEASQHTLRNADLTALSPWRRFLPGVLLSAYPGEAQSVLHITNLRIVFLRNIDIRKETEPLMTSMGIFVAMEKTVKLQGIVRAGGLQWCEIFPGRLCLAKVEKAKDYGRFRLLGDDARQYALSFWIKQGWDSGILPLIEGRFRR